MNFNVVKIFFSKLIPKGGSVYIAVIGILLITGAYLFVLNKNKADKIKMLETKITQDSFFLARIRDASDLCTQNATKNIVYYEDRLRSLNGMISDYQIKQQRLKKTISEIDMDLKRIEKEPLTKDSLQSFFDKY